MQGLIQDSSVAAVSRVIQLSVAPVFLLLGIGSLLLVMTSRLARIVDRARQVDAAVESGKEPGRLREELATLAVRAGLVYRAIACLILAALLVCGVVVALFVGASFTVDAAPAAATMFVLAMIIIVVGLLLFLREVFVATRAIRIGRDGPL